MITFNKAQIDELRQPLVYIFFKGRERLYIGKSFYGIARPFSPQHHVTELHKEADKVILLPCASFEEASALERRLIKRWKPKFNKKDNPNWTLEEKGMETIGALSQELLDILGIPMLNCE